MPASFQSSGRPTTVASERERKWHDGVQQIESQDEKSIGFIAAIKMITRALKCQKWHPAVYDENF